MRARHSAVRRVESKVEGLCESAGLFCWQMATMPVSSAPPLVWRRRAQPILGTLVEIALLCASEPEFIRVSSLAFRCIDEYHARMSFHEADSDVRAIAAAMVGETVQVAAITWAVINAAQRFEAESGGVFNVTVAPEMVRRGRLPAPQTTSTPAPLATSCCTALRLDEGAHITVLQPVWIDLGGIAKGAAVDAALALIRSEGAVAARVNAGGDIAMYGEAAQPITVFGPHGAQVEAGSLADGAIATSGPYDNDDNARSALVSPTAARWADRSVSVIAPTCQTADALTKVLAVLGPDAAPLLARHAAHGFSIDRAGRLERVA
jgi:FAD:protein FMN transferase